MNNLTETVLLIDSDPAVEQLIRKELDDARYGPFTVRWADTLSDGIAHLVDKDIKAVMLNLSLKDSQGIETFDNLNAAASCDVPFLILSDNDDEANAQLAVRRGAQDYFLKGHIDGYSLSHALRNVIARKTAEEALFVETERAQVTLNSIGDAVISADSAGNVTYLNKVAESMTGWNREEAAGKHISEIIRIIDSITREPSRNPIEMAIKKNEPVGLTATSVLIRKNGDEVPIEDSSAPIHGRAGNVIGAVMVFHDVSKARDMVEKMSHLAQHDFLTDLPNRVLLNDRLKQAISLAQRRKKQLALLYLDIDMFKDINDSLGHLVGDKLLQSVAKRLTNCVRSSDTVSRQGGDEFVVLLSEIEHENDAARRAETIISSLTEQHILEGHDLNITISIGISIYPGDGEDSEELLKNADAAMYHAKKNGRNNFQFFKKDINNQVMERQSLEAELRHALEKHEFVLHYQPRIDLNTGDIIGSEALIRWQHPVRGLVLPAQFVPIAKESGLIVPIGQWVIREACRTLRTWLEAGLRPTPISVNISAQEFRNKNFLQSIRDAFNESQLGPGYLELELTESVPLQDIESTNSVLHQLKAMGIQLAIDDFGTGSFSLSYLKCMPVDTLKIDSSFVRDMATDVDGSGIVSAVIGLGKSLNKRVIAEGIETQKQLTLLRARSCREGQGNYFSRPIDSKKYAELLGTGIATSICYVNRWDNFLSA